MWAARAKIWEETDQLRVDLKLRENRETWYCEKVKYFLLDKWR